MIEDYPESRRYAEVLFHVAKCKWELERRDEAIDAFEMIIRDFPDEPWAEYAAERLDRIR